MAKRINELRRERIRALATPQSSPFYEEDSFKIVPMSRTVERHFWDVFHKVPMSTTDPTKWKSVLKFLDSCPEKSRSGPTARDIDLTSVELNDSGAPLPVCTPRADLGGMDALRAMAVSSPAKTREDSSDFHEFVKRRVDTDTANLTISNFELDTKLHRFAGRKITAAKALLTLSPLEAMSDLYQTVFKIYMRKLERLIPKLGARSKENSSLNKLLDAYEMFLRMIRKVSQLCLLGFAPWTL